MASTDDLLNGIYKLKWASGGEWSARLSPDECAALLLALDHEKIVRSVAGAKK